MAEELNNQEPFTNLIETDRRTNCLILHGDSRANAAIRKAAMELGIPISSISIENKTIDIKAFP